MLVAILSSEPAISSRKWRRLPNMMSRSTSVAHGSPSTSTAALIGHPERGAVSMRCSQSACNLPLLRSRLATTSCTLQSLSCWEAAMPQVRVHNFSVSLDGFGTGDGLTFDAPFGHAGHRLSQWVIATQFGRRVIMGQTGGSTGVDNA